MVAWPLARQIFTANDYQLVEKQSIKCRPGKSQTAALQHHQLQLDVA